LKRLQEEVAYVAYHLHWPHDQLMALEHVERRQWVQRTAELVQRAADAQTEANNQRR
jgi:hypothetical protein